MRALNEAIEGAADYREFQRKLLEANENLRDEVQAMKEGRQPGENRQQHRARLRRERKAAAK